MPQEKDVLLTDKSLSPFSTNFTTSLFLEIGRIKSGFDL